MQKQPREEYAKFSGSRVIVGLVGLVPSCHRTDIFSHGYFVGSNIFLEDDSWAFSRKEI